MVPGRALCERGGNGCVTVETARLQWEEGTRRLESARGEHDRYRDLVALVDVVIDELRRRVGQTFTLAELAAAYDRAEDWVREALATWPAGPDDDPSARSRVCTGIRDAALIQDAAFDRYARGATDYRP